MDVQPTTLVGFLIALALVSGMLISAIRARRERQKTKQAHELLKAMFERSNVGKTETVPGGRIMRANAAFCRLLGYTESELRQKTWRELSHPDDHEDAAAPVNAMLAAASTGGDPDPVTFFVRYLSKNGVYRPAFVNVTFVRGYDCPGILLAEVQRTDEFEKKRIDIVARKGFDFVTQPIA